MLFMALQSTWVGIGIRQWPADLRRELRIGCRVGGAIEQIAWCTSKSEENSGQLQGFVAHAGRAGQINPVQLKSLQLPTRWIYP
ncbi:hypothetical protein EVAR_24060_1 [Eumeta japonica]|uniref:Uncharacterized protein n=1 Tax=Eumeta variegata TaxID=151549 RepID=A0A4C1VT67_EUMVA|nr:hypothetical protein EVAR_24060_1 [Eumeta japonica]